MTANSQLNTKRVTIHNTFLKAYLTLLLSFDTIEHAAVRVKEWKTAKYQKAHASQNEKTHQYITLPTFDEKRNPRSQAKVAQIHTLHKDDPKQNSDLNIKTTDREILEQYRVHLGHRIEDLFIWALGKLAMTEITRTVRDNDSNKMDIMQ